MATTCHHKIVLLADAVAVVASSIQKQAVRNHLLAITQLARRAITVITTVNGH